jgi:hypothetical protein
MFMSRISASEGGGGQGGSTTAERSQGGAPVETGPRDPTQEDARRALRLFKDADDAKVAATRLWRKLWEAMKKGPDEFNGHLNGIVKSAERAYKGTVKILEMPPGVVMKGGTTKGDIITILAGADNKREIRARINGTLAEYDLMGE